MKKLFIACLTVITAMTAQAQTENGMFNHLSIGVNAGTPGIGFDVAVPVGELVQLRAGYSFMPGLKGTGTFDLSGKVPTEVQVLNGKTYNIPEKVDIEGKINMSNAKVLVDVYPFKSSSFHLTAGAYYGNDDIISLKNKTSLAVIYEANQDIQAYNDMIAAGQLPLKQQKLIGVELGDYLLTADKNGNIDGVAKTKKFKPYLGLGIGRAVPRKSVGFMFEAGCMFWSNPSIYCNDHLLTADNVGGGDSGEIIEKVSSISLYPVINFRLCFKAF